MADDGRGDHIWTEQRLDQLLAEVGPLMRRQERAEAAQPDPAFERRLRERLVGAAAPQGEETRLRPAPRGRDTAPRARPPRQQRWYQRPGVWGGLAAALVALVFVSLAVAGTSGALAVAGLLAFAAILVVRARLGQ